MQEAGKPPFEILKTVILLVQQLEAIEGPKKRLEKIEVFKEVGPGT